VQATGKDRYSAREKIRGGRRFNGYPTGNLQNGEASKVAELVEKAGSDRQVKTTIGGACVTQ